MLTKILVLIPVSKTCEYGGQRTTTSVCSCLLSCLRLGFCCCPGESPMSIALLLAGELGLQTHAVTWVLVFNMHCYALSSKHFTHFAIANVHSATV